MKTTFQDFLILEHTQRLKKIIEKWAKENDFEIREYFWYILENRYINNNTYMIDAYYYIIVDELLSFEKLQQIDEIMKKNKESYNDVIKYIDNKNKLDNYLNKNKDVKTSFSKIDPKNLDCLELKSSKKSGKDVYEVYSIKYDELLVKLNQEDKIQEYVIDHQLKKIGIDFNNKEEYQKEFDNYMMYYLDINNFINDLDGIGINKVISNLIGEENYKNIEDTRHQLRKLLDTHLGKNSNPWCLLAYNSDYELSINSDYYWYNEYTGIPKKIAFKNGKVFAFCGNQIDYDLWYDLQDNEISDKKILKNLK